MVNEINFSMTMSNLPATTRCVSDIVNNISLSYCIYEWAAGTWHIAKFWYDWHNARQDGNFTQVNYIYTLLIKVLLILNTSLV